MNAARRIVKNSGASLLAQVSTPATSFVLVFFIARIAGVTGLGKFSSALSIFYIFQAFASLGFQYHITREVAQDKTKASVYIVNASFIGFIISVLIAGVMCLTVNLMTDNGDTILAVYVLSICLVPYTLALVCQSICKAFEKIEYNTVALVTGNIFKVLLGVFIITKGYGLVVLMTVILVSHFLIFFINLYLTIRCIPKNYFAIDLDFCKSIIRATPIFALIFIFGNIRWNLDNLILNYMLGEQEVGYYSAAFKLMNLCKLVISCYIAAIQPVIFRVFKTSQEIFKTVCADSIRYLFLITIPIALGTTLLSEKFVLFIFKPDFLPAAKVLCIIIWIIFFSCVNLILANALVASNNQKVNLQGVFIGMIVNICLNLLLIPKLSFIGAGIASITSSFILLVYQYSFVSRHLFKLNYFHLVKKPIISAAFMGIGILLLKDINLFFLILICMAVYVISLIALKAFSKSDMDLIRKLIRGEKNFKVLKKKSINTTLIH